jgi:flagellar motor switch/type III secretory pathway protein FliN
MASVGRRLGGDGRVNARPFDLGTCPRVPARQARATREALRASALIPARWSVDLPPIGSATVSFVGFDADAERPAGVGLPVSFGVARGRVEVEASLAIRIVDIVLGGQVVFSPARPAGPAERGVLVGVLAPVFDRIGGSVQLGPSAARDGRGAERAALTFAVQTAVGSGWLRLTPPAVDLPVVAGDGIEIWRARAGRVPVTAAVELATTNVPAGALSAAGVGDAIVFDGARASSFLPDAPWTGRLRLGDHAAQIAIGGAGELSIVGGFAPLQREEGSMSASGTDTANGASVANVANVDATTVLSAASIEVVAELGRVSLRGDELLGLAPGAVLALGGRRTGVALRVGGELWADGEIVDIDGELGVRITRLANR